MTPQTTLERVRKRQQRIWSSGEYARIGNPLVITGELLCEAVVAAR